MQLKILQIEFNYKEPLTTEQLGFFGFQEIYKDCWKLVKNGLIYHYKLKRGIPFLYVSKKSNTDVIHLSPSFYLSDISEYVKEWGLEKPCSGQFWVIEDLDFFIKNPDWIRISEFPNTLFYKEPYSKISVHVDDNYYRFCFNGVYTIK